MEEHIIALRVSQLDASELDSELFDLLRNQINGIFKYFKPTLLSRYGPEISTAVRFVLWQYTIQSDSATVGQQLLDLKYKNDRHAGSAGRWMSLRQKQMLALFTVLGPWLSDRSPYLTGVVRNSQHEAKLHQVIKWIDKGWKFASFLNFLVFLLQGRHQSLVERIVGIRAVFSHPQGVRQVGFDYMDRELLWHGFAEFLFFILPFINFRRLKNILLSCVVPKSVINPGDSVDRHLTQCAICEEWPFNPREIGCVHVFCYYCIQSNYEADAGFSCPRCGQRVEAAHNMRPVRLKSVQHNTTKKY